MIMTMYRGVWIDGHAAHRIDSAAFYAVCAGDTVMGVIICHRPIRSRGNSAAPQQADTTLAGGLGWTGAALAFRSAQQHDFFCSAICSDCLIS